MMDSTKSKRSTELDTDTKNSHWFRVERHRGEIDHLFDLYWGGKERRITGLTLKIMGVNLIAVIMLIFGVVYLSQYHTTLVGSKLEHFETEITMVAAVISDGAVFDLKDQNLAEGSEESYFRHLDMRKEDYDMDISKSKAGFISARVAATLNKRIIVFDKSGEMIVDSKDYIAQHKVDPILSVIKPEANRLESVEMLKRTAGVILSIIPQSNVLPLYEGINSRRAEDYYDVSKALNKNLSMSAWKDDQEKLILTAAMPVLFESKVVGAVMMISDGDDISESIGDAWFNILKIFLVTFLITVLLSIYLSGVIASPLRKLASAAENVRKGKLKYTEIPDMSDRNDEIGELSIVLRDMTNALWQRMDTIEAFAADVSHEIKNPLTSLKSAVETSFVVKRKKDIYRLLEVIQHDVERLDRLITDISTASRLDAALSREKFTIVDIKKLLRSIVSSYKDPMLREGNNYLDYDEAIRDEVLIRLDMRSTPDVYVMGSEGRLIQVLQNIISNALSFSPENSSINIKLSVVDSRITLTVEDEGSGIPEKQLSNIFERFYTERPEHEEYGTHSGLGLSICKQIVTAHNGVIYAENRKDGSGKTIGARFVIVLHMVKSNAEKSE